MNIDITITVSKDRSEVTADRYGIGAVVLYDNVDSVIDEVKGACVCRIGMYNGIPDELHVRFKVVREDDPDQA